MVNKEERIGKNQGGEEARQDKGKGKEKERGEENK